MHITLNGRRVKLKFKHHQFPQPIRIRSRRYDGPSKTWVKDRIVIGHTQAALWIENGTGKHKIIGESWCSIGDLVFDHERGRQHALRHLIESHFDSRDERRQIWIGYRQAMAAAAIRYGDKSDVEATAEVEPGRATEGEKEEQPETPALHDGAHGRGLSAQQAEPDRPVQWKYRC